MARRVQLLVPAAKNEKIRNTEAIARFQKPKKKKGYTHCTPVLIHTRSTQHTDTSTRKVIGKRRGSTNKSLTTEHDCHRAQSACVRVCFFHN